MSDNPLPELPAAAFSKQDASDDFAFYASLRLLTRIDEGAIAALTGHSRATGPERARVLDLMSSWISHLPAERHYADVIGHGMNAEELAANTRLTRWFAPARRSSSASRTAASDEGGDDLAHAGHRRPCGVGLPVSRERRIGWTRAGVLTDGRHDDPVVAVTARA